MSSATREERLSEDKYGGIKIYSVSKRGSYIICNFFLIICKSVYPIATMILCSNVCLEICRMCVVPFRIGIMLY